MHHSLKFIADPGHAWLQVTHQDLIASGVAESISSCSYIDDRFVYLEEDCDAPRFLRAIGSTVSDVDEEQQTTAYIRSLPPFTPAGLVRDASASVDQKRYEAPYSPPSHTSSAANDMPRFFASRSREHCRRDNPGASIVSYAGDDVEEPVNKT